MLEVEDFVRLMLGEVLRGDQTARGVGAELFDATEASLEHWLVDHRPRLCPPGDETALARMLRSLLVGLFIEHVAGVLDGGPGIAGGVPGPGRGDRRTDRSMRLRRPTVRTRGLPYVPPPDGRSGGPRPGTDRAGASGEQRR